MVQSLQIAIRVKAAWISGRGRLKRTMAPAGYSGRHVILSTTRTNGSSNDSSGGSSSAGTNSKNSNCSTYSNHSFPEALHIMFERQGLSI